MTRDDLGDEIYGIICGADDTPDALDAVKEILVLVDQYATEQCVKAILAGEVALP
jgi:hypothetical protein